MAEIYRDAHGMRLTIGECSYGMLIGWTDGDAHYPEDSPIRLGGAVHLDDKDGECASKAVTPFADTDYHGTIVFFTITKAKRALRAANAALLARDEGKPWPDWAITAQTAGWRPPKGWRP